MSRLVRLVNAARRHATLTLLIALLLAGAAVAYVPGHLEMDTDSTKLLSSELLWRKREAAFDALFPQNIELLVIVIDGATPELAEAATAGLEERLKAATDRFRSVRRPDGGPYFERNGLLFLPAAEVERTTQQMIAAQPLIGPLAADPTLRGLFDTLSTVMDGVEMNMLPFAQILAPIEGLADAIEGTLAGQSRPMSWRSLFTGDKPRSQELRRFILVRPVLDYSSLTPGAASSALVRATAQEMGFTPANGVRVRLTGPVALNDDEFGSVAKGLGLSSALSVVAVTVLLFLGLRSFKLIAAILITLIVGLCLTAAFAALSIGSLNLISVAFAVLFWGIAVDFGIQLAVAYRQARYDIEDSGPALDLAAERVGPALTIAAITTAVGFLCFLPTAYRGVSELGLIAGVGMLIALLLNLTLLPALLTLFHPPGEMSDVGFRRLRGLDRLLARRRRVVLALALLAAIAAAILCSGLEFDFNPIDIKDPHTESVATLLDLIHDPDTTPNTIDVVAPSVAEADAMARRFDKLDTVARAVSINSFVPENQVEKLAYIQDAATILSPSFQPAQTVPPPSDDETVHAMRQLATKLLEAAPHEASAKRLALDLSRAAELGPEIRMRLEATLIPGLKQTFKTLQATLTARKVSLNDVPADIRESWIAKDGQARIEIFPKGDTNDNDVLRRFVREVLDVAPDATGTPISIQESSRTIVSAFITAGALALIAITLILAVILRKARDVAMVLAPLLLAGLMTLGTCVAIGLEINFANIIALPLLFGIGVAFNIYFVMAWRRGAPALLQSSLARAVMFSAAATASAFGSLALSSHKGTAEMGLLLTLSLFYTLLNALLVLPALLGPPRDLARLQPGQHK